MGVQLSLFIRVVMLLVWWVTPVRASERFAIVVGSNTSPDKDTVTLRYADDDAVKYAQLFADLGAEVRLLTALDEDSEGLYAGVRVDGPPTRLAIAAALDELARHSATTLRRGGQSDLYLILAGHGDVQGGEGFFTLADGPLTRSDLFALLGQSTATHNHVVIDACKSYYLVFERGELSRAPYDEPFAGGADLRGHDNTGFVLSTSSAASSHEWEEYQAGVFSHEVRSALRGGADLDLDDRITYAELAAFVFAANRGVLNERYRPRFLVLPPRDQRVIMDLRDTATRELVIDGDMARHYYVEGARGVRWLDVHPDDQAVRLRLPEGRLYMRAAGDVIEYLLPAAGHARLGELAATPSRSSPRGAAHEAFSQLFSDSLSLPLLEEVVASSLYVRRAEIPLPDFGAPYRLAGWVSLGMSVALGGAGGALFFAGEQEFARYRDASFSQQAELRRRTELWDRAAAAMWIAAGVGALVTTVLFLWGERVNAELTAG